MSSILVRAELGDAQCQEMVVEGYTHGYYGFEQSPKTIEKLAKKGWPEARNFLLHGLAMGLYGFKQKPKKILKLAETLEDAKWYAVKGTALGDFGFKVSPLSLIEFAIKGWPDARDYVLEGYRKGKYGFKQDKRIVFVLKKLWEENEITLESILSHPIQIDTWIAGSEPITCSREWEIPKKYDPTPTDVLLAGSESLTSARKLELHKVSASKLEDAKKFMAAMEDESLLVKWGLIDPEKLST